MDISGYIISDSLCVLSNFKGLWLGNVCPFPRHFRRGNYCVYIVLDTWYQATTKLWHLVYPYAIKYIGMGLWDLSKHGKARKRPFNHRNDLYNDNLNLIPNRYILTFPSLSLDKTSAFELESILIDAALQFGYILSPKGLRGVQTGVFQLWNKMKGHKINGNYLRQIA